VSTMNSDVQVLDAELSRLAGRVDGPVIRAGDANYDEARAVWNGSIDRRPTAIIRCQQTADIREGLDFAVEHDLPLAVRGGGHSVAGFGTNDGGLVLDLRAMSTVEVDPHRRLAVAGPGTIGAEFDRATQEHGLATTLGVMSTTGIAGLTLGGGIGWLQRAFGLTCDNLAAAEVLTADGHLVHTSHDEHPELFWGLRGGGGNFGIVTSFEYRLHPLGPEVVCGLVAWPADKAREVLQMFRTFTADLEDELTVIAICRTAPPAPFLPEDLHGRPIIALAVCYAGPVEAGEHAVAPLREFADPAGDAIAVRPYTDFQAMFDGSWAPGFQNYWKAEYLAHLDDGIIDTFTRYALSHTSPLSDFKIAAMGGAIARVGETETACPHRDVPFVLNINTRWEDPDQSERHIRHTRALFEAAEPASAGGVYVNFLGDEGTERIEHAYRSDTFARLQALKRQWDPNNVLHINHNIPPA
jgi:FAD/FMN-containing dehydrogenase